MTPLARLLARLLPRPLNPLALAALYAAMMLAIAAVGTTGGTNIVYVDIGKHR